MEHHFIKNRDIILFGFQPWDTDIGSNFKDMALELSRYNRVLYVNRALDRSFLARNKNSEQVKARLASIRTGAGELNEVQPNLWVLNPRTLLESINWIPLAWLHDLLNRVNNRRLAFQINKISSQLGFKDVMLINDNDFIRGRYLKEMLGCKDYVFYIRDYMLGVKYFQRHGHRLEKGTMQAADLVVANSSYLAQYASTFNANSFDIGQGCDLANYTVTEKPPLPEDLRAITRPIIGYVGYISAWRMDIDTIAYLAEHLPDYQVVLVGPDDLGEKKAQLSAYTNLHLLGRKPQEALSNYIYYFDVCINPQVLNEVTIGNYPRKVDEYLAMGKPVVATRTEAMKLFEPYTYLCSSKEEYVDKIRMILGDAGHVSEQKMKERMSFAFSHTWEESIGKLGDAYYSIKQTKR